MTPTVDTKTPTGFGGLTLLVSDGTRELEAARREAARQPNAARAPAGTRKPTADADATAGSRPGIHPLVWIVGGVLLVFASVAFFSRDEGPSLSRGAGVEYATSAVPSPAPVDRDFTPDPVQAAPVEVQPSLGGGQLLSSAEIRYCLAQDIRLEGARDAVDQSSDRHVNVFNQWVTDYNSRCGRFRYRPGALESVRRQVDADRERLLAVGRAGFLAEIRR
jgi:hypothetical protein